MSKSRDKHGFSPEQISDAAEKIQKLLRLALDASTNDHEAEIAGQRAQAIADKYQIVVTLTHDNVVMTVGSDESKKKTPDQERIDTLLESFFGELFTAKLRKIPLPLDGPTPSLDQAEAIWVIVNELRRGVRVTSLAGLAGTGKTWLVRTLVAVVWFELGLEAEFCAPTGKAAVRLTALARVRATTIHRILYGRLDEDDDGELHFSEPKAPVQANTLLVVDESSMLDEVITQDIVRHLPPGAAVLFIGDPRQLKPVNGKPGVDLWNPTASLTTIHRQAQDSGIIRTAHATLTGIMPSRIPSNPDFIVHKADKYSDLARFSLDAVVEWFADIRAQNPDPNYATLVAYTRDTCHQLNKKLRIAKGFAQAGPILAAGDIVVVGINQHEYYNGETYTLHDVRRAGISDLEMLADAFGGMPEEDRYLVRLVPGGRRYLVASEMMGRSQGDYRKWLKANVDKKDHEDWIHLDLGDCLTVHRAQGSGWPIVGVVWDSPVSRMRQMKQDDAISWAYTAITRAEKTCHLWRTDW